MEGWYRAAVLAVPERVRRKHLDFVGGEYDQTLPSHSTHGKYSLAYRGFNLECAPDM